MRGSQKSEKDGDTGADDSKKVDPADVDEAGNSERPARRRKAAGGEGGGEVPSPSGAAASDKNSGGSEPKDQGAEPDSPLPDIPSEIDLNRFQQQSLVELYQLGTDLGLRVGGSRSKHQLVFDLLQFYGRKGSNIVAEGVLEAGRDGAGYLRWAAFNFAPTPDSVFVPVNLVRSNGIRQGNLVRVSLKRARDRDKHLCADEVIAVEGEPIESWEPRKPFDKLTALSPRERLILEHPDKTSVGARIVDLIAPLGKGQRG